MHAQSKCQSRRKGRFDLTKTGDPSRLAYRFVQLSKPRQDIVEKLTGLVKRICKNSKTKHPGACVVAEGWNTQLACARSWVQPQHQK